MSEEADFDADTDVPHWVNVVVPIVMALLYLLTLVILYHTDKEIPIEKLEERVPRVSTSIYDESDSEVTGPESEEKFYSDAKEYWSKIPSTVDGMLGGFEKISPTDINGSKAFLRPFLKIARGKTNTHRALDCGAGIGRITKRLLLPMFETVDMVELNQKFLDSAKSFIGQEAHRVGRLMCSGLQDFTPEVGHYDVIWSQWVLGHLTEDHLIEFLKRCKAGLTPDGIIVIKENVSGSGENEYDDEDSSFTRCKDYYVNAMKNAGLTILKEERQKGFPKGLYSVYMFALK